MILLLIAASPTSQALTAWCAPRYVFTCIVLSAPHNDATRRAPSQIHFPRLREVTALAKVTQFGTGIGPWPAWLQNRTVAPWARLPQVTARGTEETRARPSQLRILNPPSPETLQCQMTQEPASPQLQRLPGWLVTYFWMWFPHFPGPHFVLLEEVLSGPGQLWGRASFQSRA